MNSVYGYDTGDQILKGVSANLSSQPIDIKAIGRIGGDVFAVIIDGAVIKNQLVKVLKELVPTIYYNNHEITVVCYFGIIKSDKSCKDYSSDFTKAELGFVPPNEFIAVAENTMLIHILGKHLSEQAGRFALGAAEVGLNGKISINVSGIELAKLDFADRFIESMKQVGADKRHIAIEVTETGLIHNMKIAATHLNRLKGEGYSIYLDDFGTGYSSLSYLDQLPIDILKIDKVFVDQVLMNEKKRSMLTDMIGLASILEIKTVAEGVETQEQYELLKEMGIDFIQGYYFSKAVDSERAMGMLKDELA